LEETVQQQAIRVTESDSRRLEVLIEGSRPRNVRDAGSLQRLESQLSEAEVVPGSGIDPDVVTMDSEVRVRHLDTDEVRVFRVVYPSAAAADAGRISVLAPLGMAVLGRAAGETVLWPTPGGLRRLRIEGVLYQPERAAKEVA
jgi:regulator of nucleoside diphosphate kinase